MSVKDDELRVKIVGTWTEGIAPNGFSTFLKDGGYIAFVFDSILKIKLLCVVRGKWWIDNGKLYNSVDQIEPALMAVPKESSVDIINEISDSVLQLTDQKGRRYNKRRCL